MSDSDLAKQLKQKGYKLTAQRQAVINVISKNSERHLSIEQIYDLVRKDCSDIGLATVYRNLLLFVKLGFVHKLDFDDGYSRYELNTNEKNHRHHHLICMNCGSVTSMEEDLLGDLEKKVLDKYNFKIKDHRVKFYGYCRNCINKNK